MLNEENQIYNFKLCLWELFWFPFITVPVWLRYGKQLRFLRFWFRFRNIGVKKLNQLLPAVFSLSIILNTFQISAANDWRRQSVSGGDSPGFQAGLACHEIVDDQCWPHFKQLSGYSLNLLPIGYLFYQMYTIYSYVYCAR